jgi:hypothetical protein
VPLLRQLVHLSGRGEDVGHDPGLQLSEADQSVLDAQFREVDEDMTDPVETSLV